MNNSIGFKIKKLREAKDLSQDELAFLLQTSQGNISKIESDTIEKLDFLFMQKVCEFFQVDFKYFLDENVSQINKETTSSAISIYGNPTVNNNFPDIVLEQVKYLVESNKKKDDEIIDLKVKLSKFL